MDKATLRPYVFDILKKTPQTHFHAIENDLRKLTDEYERHDVLTLQEILWELLVQGVLAPGKNSLNLNLPFVHLTEYGASCLEDGRMLIHDPDGYLDRLSRGTEGVVDSLVIESVSEALGTFLAGNLASSIILLARAAEVLFDRLSCALLDVLDLEDGATQALQAAPRFSRSRAQRVIRSLMSRPFASTLAEDIEPKLNGLLSLLQLSRGKDGSPRWPKPSRDSVLGSFLLFPDQCAFVYHLLTVLEGTAEVREATD